MPFGEGSLQGVPPLVALRRLLGGHWISQAVSVAAELRLADRLAEGSRSAEELAAASAAHPEALYRLLRALATVGVFKEVAPRRFGLTPAANYLREGVPGSLRSIALLIGRLDWTPWGELLHSVRTEDAAFRRVHGVGPFEYFESHPEVGRVFDRAMTEFVSQNGAAAVEAYDFSAFRRVVDVGGGEGTLLSAVLRANPSVRGVLFDLPRVVEGARRRLQEGGLSARCECVAGDFFESVPGGGDAYLLASVVHDWGEEQALQILRNCRRAMDPEAALLLIEMVLPADDAPFYGKWLDLHMMVTVGGRERTGEEYRELLERGGFRLVRIVRTATPSSVIEARSSSAAEASRTGGGA